MAPAAIDTIETIPNFTSLPAILEKAAYIEHGGINDKNETPKGLIGSTLKDKIQSIDHETCDADEENTFFVADLGEVYRQHMRWKLNLPRIKPFYAVKCNPDAQVIRLLSELGTGFDCASKAEIAQVLSTGVSPSRIIYAQPCKTNSYVRYAKSQGVSQMTFDNADELYKIQKLYPTAELFLRISTDDSSSLCQLSLKFGASMDSAFSLLSLAKELELNVVGVSFHVGSGASDPFAFLKAVQDARTVFDEATKLGFAMQTLDVGGGFVSETFEAMAAVLSGALDKYFPPNVSIIGEPGRYYVASAFTLASNVIARRTVVGEEERERGGEKYMLYLNDGLYGNFSSIMFDHQNPVAKLLQSNGSFLYDTAAACQLQVPSAAPLRASSITSAISISDSGHDINDVEYSIWGPTCDGIDRIAESAKFEKVAKRAVDVGDWLYFEDMGAYTKCSATRFNGFADEHEVLYVVSEAGARALLGM